MASPVKIQIFCVKFFKLGWMFIPHDKSESN